MAKNERKLDPLLTADFYGRHFDNGEVSITSKYTDGSDQVFDFKSRIDDRATSLAASVFVNSQDGHAIIFYKGTDLPIIRDEGSGRFAGFIKDIQAIFQSKAGQVSRQTLEAERVYLDIMREPSVQSVEIVGYSIGSQHVNYLAAKHRATGTTIADMGIHPDVLGREFQDDKSGKSINEQMLDRVSVLHLAWDKLPKWFAAGPSVGQSISLDQGHFDDIIGLAHIPQTYAHKAKAKLVP
ncbi:MAG: hypothetical protein J0L77_05750 [Alphaproteobacteria bacterium]|nr:hypothetical protein [Alphaproteobacteria bacterium]